MTTPGRHTSIGEQLEESWRTTLEINAAFDRPWVDAATAWLVERSAPGPAVDVGCGAGGAACALAHRLGAAVAGGEPTVVAVDRDPQLLDIARRRADAEGVAGRIRWATGTIGDLPVPAGSAAVVWASGVVHHIADQQAAVDELAGLLVDGGALALGEGGLPLRCLPDDIGVGRQGLEARLDEARSRWFADMRAELHGPRLPYGWPAALARAGLHDVRTRSFLAEAPGPVDDLGRQIATMHLTSALSELAGYLPDDDRATLARLLDPDDPAWIGRRDDLVVVAVRTLHVGTR